MERTASVIKMCPWLSHVVIFSPLKGLYPDLKAFLPSFSPPSFSPGSISPAQSVYCLLSSLRTLPTVGEENSPWRFNPKVLPSRTYPARP